VNTPAIIVLGQNSVVLGKRIQTGLTNATLYGLDRRTIDVDVSFANFGETLRSLFTQARPIIGICAAGILIRTLAPLLTDKRQEPPVIAIAEDGSAVVPLLGGLHGVNDLARQIAAALEVQAAITTTGDLRFRTALLSPPPGYCLANPGAAKTFISDLLAGATVKLLGNAPWLADSKLPIAADGQLTLQVTERAVTPAEDCLVYYPTTLAIGISSTISPDPVTAIAHLQQILTKAELAPAAIAGVFGLASHAGHSGIQAIAEAFNVPARFFEPSFVGQAAERAETIAIAAAGAASQLVVQDQDCAIAVALRPLDANTVGRPQGRLAIVGTGPGSAEWMSPEVKQLLHSATDWVGYSTYLNLIEPLRTHQQRHDSDNRQELDRARLALNLAAAGRFVAVVSSGDPGIYAMAAAVFEALEQDAKPAWQQIAIQVAPGISALQAAAARIGAPIGHDFCVISLSDILKPWSAIAERITAAAAADFVIAFYNPVSQQRTWQLDKARELLLAVRSPDTPVVLARNLGRAGESVVVRSLSQLSANEVDMRTLVLVGSGKTRIIQQRDRAWVYTPRHY
jgi:cobalt-precorrin 5A hydrolase/precorrin-3B C17-methyltransferase